MHRHSVSFRIDAKARTLAILLLLLVGTRAATAGFISGFAQARSSVTSDNVVATPESEISVAPTYNSGNLAPTGTISKSDGTNANNIYGSNAQAEYDIFAAVGTLKARTQSNASAAADAVNNPDLFNVAGAFASTQVEWGDELIVTAGAGKTVTISAHVQLTASGNRADTTLDTFNSLYFRFLLPGMNFVTVTQDNLVGGFAYDQIFLLTLSPGTYNLSQQLRTEASAAARINDPNPSWKSLSVSVMDAGNTAKLYLDLVSPEGSFRLASGADLSTPDAGSDVPEPVSALLAAAGLAVVAGLRRRAR